MKQLLMWIANPRRVSYLTYKSANLFNVFTKTVVKIDKVNQQIQTQELKIKDLIAKQQQDLNILADVRSKNEKVKAKIEEFLN